MTHRVDWNSIIFSRGWVVMAMEPNQKMYLEFKCIHTLETHRKLIKIMIWKSKLMIFVIMYKIKPSLEELAV